MGLEWYILCFYYARCKPAPYNLYSMFYMVNISGLGLNNPKLSPDLDSTLIYALFTIMTYGDRYICKYHTCIYCIGVVRDEPYRLHQYRKQNMTTKNITKQCTEFMTAYSDIHEYAYHLYNEPEKLNKAIKQMDALIVCSEIMLSYEECVLFTEYVSKFVRFDE